MHLLRGHIAQLLKSVFVTGAKRVPSPPSTIIRKALALGQGTRVRLLNYTKAGVPLWNDLSILPLRYLPMNPSSQPLFQLFPSLKILVSVAAPGA